MSDTGRSRRGDRLRRVVFHTAERASDRGHDPTVDDNGRALLDALAGDTVSARSWLERQPPSLGSGVAVLLAHIGEVDSAFAILEEIMRERGFINRLPSSPVYDPLRGDPRFDVLLREMNLECEYYEDGTHRCWEYGTRGEGS